MSQLVSRFGAGERIVLTITRPHLKAGTAGIVVNLKYHASICVDSEGWWMYLVQFEGQEKVTLCHDHEMQSAQCWREFKNGDLITGIDRSYPRSIYRVLDEDKERVLAAVVSLDGFIAEGKCNADGVPLKNEWELGLGEYRLATEQEIFLSAFERPKLIPNNQLKCECGNPKNPTGQGHSDWCKLFRREF